MPKRNHEIEKRTFPASLQLRGTAREPVLEGHIAVFNQLSEDFGGWREKIAPGAFSETIKRDDIRALWNHEDGLVLGRLSAGTLNLSEDATGLAFRNTPPNTTWVKDRLVSVRRGDVTGASFGFFTEDDRWDQQADGTKLRTLLKVTLVEVSPGVTFPAYPQTDVAQRSMREWFGSGARAGVDPNGLRERQLRLHEMSLGLPKGSSQSPNLARIIRLKEMERQLEADLKRAGQEIAERARRLRRENL
ncbi:MAG TPA: HK97 family phage prohead protease [Candidatus Polarisedimenticolia bacterium]|jgi:hypothetical protein|nr:HK97 family phage prohead protease [Candidatus Polarisedimenticolia bacterium]